MALQTQGAISLLDIQNEFGGSNPISISEYYSAAAGIPASGTISIGQFYGKAAAGAVVYDQPGTYTWTVVADFTAVAIGAGSHGNGQGTTSTSDGDPGGGGGALKYKNNATGYVGQTATVFVPAASAYGNNPGDAKIVIGGVTVLQAPSAVSSVGGNHAQGVGTGGGSGGSATGGTDSGGGGGAGGYGGAGGNGGKGDWWNAPYATNNYLGAPGTNGGGGGGAAGLTGPVNNYSSNGDGYGGGGGGGSLYGFNADFSNGGCGGFYRAISPTSATTGPWTFSIAYAFGGYGYGYASGGGNGQPTGGTYRGQTGYYGCRWTRAGTASMAIPGFTYVEGNPTTGRWRGDYTFGDPTTPFQIDSNNIGGGGWPGGGGSGQCDGSYLNPIYGTYNTQRLGGYGAPGAVRIVWPGATKQFPYTDIHYDP